MNPAAEAEVSRIYSATLDDLYGFVSRRCDGDRDLAEDITQETWLRAVRAWADHGLPDQPLAWLMTVAGRLLSNHLRKPEVRGADRDALELLPAPDSDRAADSTQRRSLLERALSKLPLPQSRLLEAFHFDRRRVADIATESGLSERAVEGRLRRARENLRQHIESEDESHD